MTDRLLRIIRGKKRHATAHQRVEDRIEELKRSQDRLWAVVLSILGLIVAALIARTLGG